MGHFKEINYEYAVIAVHPDNIASNKVTEYTGAKIAKTTNLGDYLRNIYLLKKKLKYLFGGKIIYD